MDPEAPARKVLELISRLRLSSHHLMIEKGRHARPVIPATKRCCSLCNDRIDDEVHFLIECTKFRSLRNHMFPKVHHLLPPSFNITFNNQDKFVYLLQTDDMEILISVAKFIQAAWQ